MSKRISNYIIRVEVAISNEKVIPRAVDHKHDGVWVTFKLKET
jgi:hypothetical protein